MKVKILLILMGSILFLQNCTTSVKMAAVSSSAQKTGYDGTVISQKKYFVALSPYTKLTVVKGKAMFIMSIQNHGEAPINITYDNISVIFEDNTRKGAPDKINVQSYDDVISGFTLETRFMELGKVGGTLVNINGQLKYILDELRKGRSNYIITELIASVDFYAKDKREELERMSSQNQQVLEALPDFVMTPQTIMPGDSYSGMVVCDTRHLNPKKEGNFRITVSVDGEEHKFIFNRSLLNTLSKKE